MAFALENSPLFAQTLADKEQLEQNRKHSAEKLEKTSRILESIRAKKMGELARLRTINSEMRQREELMKQVEAELLYIAEEIWETSEIVASLEQDLEGLKSEYSAMLYMLSKTQNRFERLSYVFSSNTFNQLMARINYFGQYKEFRHHQIKQIMDVKDMLDAKKALMERRRTEQEELLETSHQQTLELASLRKEQSKLVERLKRREVELRVEIEKEQRVIEKLNQTIAKLVGSQQQSEQEEPVMVETSLEEQTDNLTASVETVPAASTESTKAASFPEMKNKLPWPVKDGFVSRHFGKQEHPVFEGIWIENLGLDIATNDSEPVFAVSEGKVIAVTKVPGMHHIVTLQHGKYYTVYARLKSTQVKVGQYVGASDEIGTVANNKEGVAELQFQIWHEQHKLNPEEWLTQ